MERNYRRRGGLDAVRSDVGFEIYAKTCLRDDGVKGFGGGRIAAIGPMRVGKTTLGLTVLPMIHFIGSVPKEKFLASKDKNMSLIVKETIVYRGRKLDYWNAFTKQHYSKCFPGIDHRELKVFIYKDDDIQFFEEQQEENIMAPIKGLNVYKYGSQEDLYNNLVEGGINVVYVPNDYKLSPLLKNVLNEMRMLSEGDGMVR